MIGEQVGRRECSAMASLVATIQNTDFLLKTVIFG